MLTIIGALTVVLSSKASDEKVCYNKLYNMAQRCDPNFNTQLTPDQMGRAIVHPDICVLCHHQFCIDHVK